MCLDNNKSRLSLISILSAAFIMNWPALIEELLCKNLKYTPTKSIQAITQLIKRWHCCMNVAEFLLRTSLGSGNDNVTCTMVVENMHNIHLEKGIIQHQNVTH